MNSNLTNLAPGTKYEVQVRALNANSQGPWSPVFEFTTIHDVTPPPPVTNLTTVSTGTSFLSTWTRPTGDTMVDFNRYEVEVQAGATTKKYNVTQERFDLTLEMNYAAFGAPQGSVTVRVRTVDHSGNASDFVSASATNPLPGAPTAVTAVGTTATVVLRWTAPADTDIVRYDVYTNTSNTFTGATKVGQTSDTSFTHANTNYTSDTFYFVKTVDVFGGVSTGQGASGAVRPKNYVAFDTVAPGVPTISSATITTASTSATSATVVWTLASPPSDFNGVQIQYRRTGTTGWEQRTVNRDDTTVVFTGLTPYVNYDFQIRAFDFNYNYSAWSATTVATGGTNSAPAAVTGLTLSASANAVTARWTESTEDDVKNGAGLYEVDIATNSAFTTGLLTYRTGANSITISGLSPSVTYHLRVRAVDNQGLAGAYSSTANTTTTAFPSTAQSNGAAPASSPTPAVTAGIGYLFASWPAVSAGTLPGDTVFYEIHVSTTNGFTPTKGAAATLVATTPGTFATIETTAAGTPLAYGTTYYVRLIAFDVDGAAAPGPQASGAIAKVGAADSTLTAGDVGAPTTSAFSTLSATVNTSLKSSVIEYAVNGSETTAPATGWSTTQPTRTPGTFVWFRTIITYNDNTTATSSPALLTGNTGATGATGTPAANVVLTASTQVLSAPSGGGTTSPATSTVTGSAINTTITVWEYSVDGAAFSTTVPAGVSRTGNTVTLTGASMTARTITVRMADANGVADTITVARVFDGATGTAGTNGTNGAAGADAYTVLLTNEAQVFAGTTTAAQAGTATTTVIAYKGTAQQTATIGTITGLPTGMTAAITNNGATNATVTFTVTTAMTTASGTVTIPVTVGGVAFTKTFSYSIAFAGAAGTNGTNGVPAANIVLTSPTQVLSLPAGASVTTPASTVVTGAAFNTTITVYEYSVDGAAYSTTVPTGVSRTGNAVTITGQTMTAKTISVRMSDANGVSDTFTVAKVADGAAGTNGTNGTNGANGYTVLLSNEAQVFPGNVTSANAGTFTTQPIAYQGTTQQSVTVGTITGQVTGLTTAVTNNGTTAPTITVTTTTALTTPAGTLTIPLTVNGVAFTQTFSWSIAFAGAAGTNGTNGTNGAPASTVDLTTNTQVLATPAGGGATTPATATVTGTATNTTISTWDYSVDGGAFSTTAPAGVSRAGNVVTVTGASVTARTIAVRATGASGVTDTITLAKVSDGATGTAGTNGTNGTNGTDGYTVILTNEAQTMAGTTTAAVANTYTTSVIAYRGSTQQTATIGTITGLPTGMTAAITNNGTNTPTVTFTVTTAMTTASGTVTIPVTVNSIVFNRQFAYAIAFAGAQGNTGNTGNTGAAGVGVSSITPYFRTVTPTGAAAPAAPTTDPPGAPWTTTEPDYVVNTDLYRTERIVYTNATFAYTTPTKVSSYAAAATAITTANGKNKVYYSTGTPGSTANTAGDVWFVRDTTTGIISAQYEGGGGTTWTARTLGSTTIASITAGQIATGTLNAITITIPANGAIQSADYVPGSAGFKLISGGLDIQGGTVNARTLQANSAFVTTLNVGAGGAVQSTGYTPGGTSGFQLSSSGLVIKGTNNQVSAAALVTGTITAQTITVAGASGSGASIVVDAYGEMRSNNWSSLSTGWRLYGGGAGAGSLEINQGSIDAGTLRANTAIVTDLIIGRNADAAGTVSSFGYTPGGTTGFRLSKSGLDVREGTIAARALEIQEGSNLFPAVWSSFEAVPSSYTGITVSGSGTADVVTTQAKFDTQSLRQVNTGAGEYIIYLPPLVEVEGNAQYIVSAYGMADAIPAEGEIFVRFSDGSFQNGGGAHTMSTAWGRKSIVVTAPAAATTLQVRLDVNTPGRTIFWDGIQVEKKIGSINTPSPWKPAGVTRVDAGIIRTGALVSTGPALGGEGAAAPAWSINLAGSAEFGDVLVRGSIVVGRSGATSQQLTDTVIKSANYTTGSAGYVVRGDGTVEFNKGTFRDNLAIGTPGSEKFFVDGATGNLGIGGTSATTGNFRVSGSDGSVVIGAGSINLGSGAFAVTNAGALTATSGTIGGFTLGTSQLTATNIGISSGTYAFWAGNNVASSAEFRVTNSGAVTTGTMNIAGTATVTGKIRTASTGARIELGQTGSYFGDATQIEFHTGDTTYPIPGNIKGDYNQLALYGPAHSSDTTGSNKPSVKISSEPFQGGSSAVDFQASLVRVYVADANNGFLVNGNRVMHQTNVNSYILGTSHSHTTAQLPTGTTSTTVALGNHGHTGYASSSHDHIIGDLPTGTSSTTVALGNHGHTGLHTHSSSLAVTTAALTTNGVTRIAGTNVLVFGDSGSNIPALQQRAVSTNQVRAIGLLGDQSGFGDLYLYKIWWVVANGTHSARDLKKDIVSTNAGAKIPTLKDIRSLKLYTYKIKDGDPFDHTGVMADEVPEIFKARVEPDHEMYGRGIESGEIAWGTVAGVQELANITDYLMLEIRNLKAEVAALKAGKK